MNKKYLAYIALLAGWLCFCYWLYAKAIAPRFHGDQEKSGPQFVEDLQYPLAFRWASDVPLAGIGYEEWKNQFHSIDSTQEWVIVRGFFFRDEADSLSELQDLGFRRIHNALKYLAVNKNRLVPEVLYQEINADVRTNPFEAIRFERIPYDDLVSMTHDTFEICFPLKDSLTLPPLAVSRLNNWSRGSSRIKSGILHIVGTADGTGIAESIDTALERAIYIKEKMIKEGWKEDQIELSTGQRNDSLTLRNRCVIVYFE